MAKDHVGTSDGVSVSIERAPEPKPETSRPLLCPQCGGPTVEAENSGWRACTNPDCLHSCTVGACITGLN